MDTNKNKPSKPKIVPIFVYSFTLITNMIITIFYA